MNTIMDNQDLPRLTAAGLFREELYYRINVMPIHLPPLRGRREDMPILVDEFIERGYLKNRQSICWKQFIWLSFLKYSGLKKNLFLAVNISRIQR